MVQDQGWAKGQAVTGLVITELVFDHLIGVIAVHAFLPSDSDVGWAGGK